MASLILQPIKDVFDKIERMTPSISCIVNELEISARFNNFSCRQSSVTDHEIALIISYLPCLASLLVMNVISISSTESCSNLDFDAVGNIFADCQWCTENYGCFQAGGPFISNCHPITFPPQPEACLDLKLQLYTRFNPKIPQRLNINLSNLHQTEFNMKEKTMFLIGGWLEGNFKPYDELLIKSALKMANINVIIFDWNKGSGSFYGQSVANTRLLGRMLAYVIRDLQNKFGYSSFEVHLVGHSAGVPLVGYAGKEARALGLTIGRITGLDPAGPYFNCEDATVRLNATDASFVDVIHTNAGDLGDVVRNGDVDFWPNGGKCQKGCDLIRRLFDPKLDDKFGCDHTMAIYLFAYSMYSGTPSGNCTFRAHMCANYAAFEAGKCGDCGESNSRCARMGYFADQYYEAGHQLPAKDSFYLNTLPDAPHCEDLVK